MFHNQFLHIASLGHPSNSSLHKWQTTSPFDCQCLQTGVGLHLLVKAELKVLTEQQWSHNNTIITHSYNTVFRHTLARGFPCLKSTDTSRSTNSRKLVNFSNTINVFTGDSAPRPSFRIDNFGQVSRAGTKGSSGMPSPATGTPTTTSSRDLWWCKTTALHRSLSGSSACSEQISTHTQTLAQHRGEALASTLHTWTINPCWLNSKQ